MTLYLKYRPQTLDELDITSVRELLKKIVSSDNIPQAFLFSGPKGTGKTSTARILAKILNCEQSTVNSEPCNKCQQCVSITNGSNLDVIELDAASNRGIDDIRTLRDGVKLAPISAKKKVYIIDEAHMLTTEASNALLKTLEEPPSHVIFILATTNPEKLIGTIHSRVTKVNFTKATDVEIKRSLARVINGEKIKIEDEVLDNVVQKANGSFRDGVKLLESFAMGGEDSLQQISGTQVISFVDYLYKKDQEKLLNAISELVKNGESIENFVKNLLLELRKNLLQDTAKTNAVELIELLMEVPEKMKYSPIEELPLEIAIVKHCLKGNENSDLRFKIHENKKQVTASEESHKSSIINHTSGSVDEIKWKEILAKVKPINASIEALLRSSRPIDFDGRVLRLGVFYKFHKERLEDARNRKILEDVAGELFGNPIRINCLLTDPPKQIITESLSLTENKDNDIVEVAKTIFGT